MVKEENLGDTNFNTSGNGQSPFRELRNGWKARRFYRIKTKEQVRDK